MTAEDLGIYGILMVHVDDLLFGGGNEKFWHSIANLQGRFDFGTWKDKEGDHLGVTQWHPGRPNANDGN